jgi:thioredoxin-like negative regulator of GroEL
MVNQVPAERFRASDLPPGRVAVMFTADWCGYCHRFLAHYKRIRAGWVVDVTDEDDPLWDVHRLQVVPTVLVFQDGLEVRRWQGVLAAHHVDQIEEALAASAQPG